MFDHFPRTPFSVNSEGHVLRGDRNCSDTHSSLLCLHGAGTSIRERFTPLRKELYKKKFSSAAFDFIGHGETGGCLQTSSLKERFQQSCDVIEFLKLAQPLSIIGASMSGYIAIKLLERYPVKDLILFVPAVYHEDAYCIPFNQGFSEMIRQPKSWLHTDAWRILQQFRGNLLIITAEKDEVIPDEIIHRLYESARLAKSRQHYIVREAPHKILAFLNDNILELQNVSNIIGEFVKAD